VFAIGFAHAAGGVLTCTDVVGTLGASTGIGLTCTKWTDMWSGLTVGPGVCAMPLGLGLMRAGAFDVWAAGVVSAGAPVAGVCTHSATSPFDGVTVGLGSVQTDCELCGGVVRQVWCGVGTHQG
jgi:hypothetical protein